MYLNSEQIEWISHQRNKKIAKILFLSIFTVSLLACNESDKLPKLFLSFEPWHHHRIKTFSENKKSVKEIE